MDNLFGSVNWWNNKRGFGLIKGNDEKEYFVHHSSIQTEGFVELAQNQKVTFKFKNLKGKDCAIDVKIAGPVTNILSKKNHKKKRFPKNTVDFKPSHQKPDMRVVTLAPDMVSKTKLTDRDVILVSGLFEENIYQKLLEELSNAGITHNNLWKLWHGDTHLIADDKKKWKEKCPTFEAVITKLEEIFNMKAQATRLNWYRNNSEWKPFHHDAAAIKKDKAKTQNITVGVSFGVERSVAFQHAKTNSVTAFPLPNGSVYAFGKETNKIWKHGILQLKNDNSSAEPEVEVGRISIIAWGWTNLIGH